jgi:hypothetical protein
MAPTSDGTMSLNEPERQALGSIEDGLAGSDPRLAAMLNIFSRLAAGEEMPVRKKLRVRRERLAARGPRLARRHPRRDAVLPQARGLYARLGSPQAMLLLWVVITSGLIAVALILNTQRPPGLYPVDGNGVPLFSRPAACRCIPVDLRKGHRRVPGKQTLDAPDPGAEVGAGSRGAAP